MAEITYLLGAGASYNSLPIVEKMATAVGETINWLSNKHNEVYPRYEFMLGSYVKKPHTEREDAELSRLIDDLRWLEDICNTQKNFSVDTYARKLHISGRVKEYQKLKNVLSFFFTLEQRRNPPDVRYDNFWASILKSKDDFPKNIKIISWNYDFQLELTYTGFFDIDSLTAARETLKITSQEKNTFDSKNLSDFCIFKLNGSATFSSKKIDDSEVKYMVDDFSTSSTEKFLKIVIERYDKLNENNSEEFNHLKFAWEHNKTDVFFKQLKQSISSTQILVVIGYSFPFFNRDTDKYIFDECMRGSLEKVYFQAPDAEDLRERFLAINNRVKTENLFLRKDLKQFTLPNEL